MGTTKLRHLEGALGHAHANFETPHLNLDAPHESFFRPELAGSTSSFASHGGGGDIGAGPWKMGTGGDY